MDYRGKYKEFSKNEAEDKAEKIDAILWWTLQANGEFCAQIKRQRGATEVSRVEVQRDLPHTSGGLQPHL